MNEVDVIAVLGTCAPERERHAAALATACNRVLSPARNLVETPDPLGTAVLVASRSAPASRLVVELPTTSIAEDVIAEFVRERETVRLTGIVCVVDASHLLSDLNDTDDVDHAALTVEQLEYASMIVLVNWQQLSTPELSTAMALASHLSPNARLRLEYSGVGAQESAEDYAAEQLRPGWVAILNGEHHPHMTDPRVTAVRYDSVRPFHPERLERFLSEHFASGEFGSVVRSAGFCRFATRPGIVAEWDHVGQGIRFEPLQFDDGHHTAHEHETPLLAQQPVAQREMLTVGQDLAFVGLDLQRDALVAALDAAVLTDAELTQGPNVWARYGDPFPAWDGLESHQPRSASRPID